MLNDEKNIQGEGGGYEILSGTPREDLEDGSEENQYHIKSLSPTGGYDLIPNAPIDLESGALGVNHEIKSLRPRWLKRYEQIPNDVNAVYRILQDQLKHSTPSHRQLEKVFPWEKSILENTTKICISGASWEDEKFAENFTKTGKIVACAAQGDEVFYVFFTVKESVLGIGVLNLPPAFTIPLMILLGIGQTMPNVVQVDPDEFGNYIRPPQAALYLNELNKKQPAALKIKNKLKISDQEAQWLDWALRLKQQEEKGIKPKTWGDRLLKLLEYAAPTALTAGLMYSNTSSLSVLARGLLTAFTGVATLGASKYNLVLPLVRFIHHWVTPIGFWGCTFLGTIAQLDGINSLYSDPFPIGPTSWSPYLKFLIGALGWFGIGFYALKDSHADSRLKYATAAVWGALFSSWGAVELMVSANLFELTPAIRLGLQISWLTFFVGPGGGAYYWLQVKDVTNKMRKIYFTKDSPIYQLFQINPLVALEAIVQYVLNVGRRGTGMAAIPEVIAEWSGVSYLVNPAKWLEPVWLLMGLQSTAITRTKAFDFALAPYMVELPDGQKMLVNDKRLLTFQCQGDAKPANQMVKLSGCEKFWAFVKAFFLNGIVAIGLYLYVKAITGSKSTAFEVAGAFFLTMLGLSTYTNMVKDHEAKTSQYIQNKIFDGQVPTYSKGAWALTAVTLGSDGILRILAGANLNKRISFLDVFPKGQEKENFVSMSCFNAEPQVSETLFILEKTLAAAEEDIEKSQLPNAGWYHKGIGLLFGPRNIGVRAYESLRSCCP